MTDMRIDAQLAATVAAVVDEGSFEAAARRLHITQSAVSQRIKAMEEQSGRVLVRRSKPIEPTEAGAVLLRLARQLELLTAELAGRRPRIPTYSVCVECKRRGAVCVMVADGTPCLGPVTQAGCGALCPAYSRGCYGCFGPQDTPNTRSEADRLRALGRDEAEVLRMFRTFNAASEPFRQESRRHEAARQEVAP